MAALKVVIERSCCQSIPLNFPHSSPLTIILRELCTKESELLYQYQNGTLCALFLECPLNILGPLLRSVSQWNGNKGNGLLEIFSSLHLRPHIKDCLRGVSFAHTLNWLALFCSKGMHSLSCSWSRLRGFSMVIAYREFNMLYGRTFPLDKQPFSF